MKLLKLASGLLGGSTDGLFTDFSVCSFSYLTHFHALTHPFIDPSSSTSWLGKGNQNAEY
jgi:hypothetical protein